MGLTPSCDTIHTFYVSNANDIQEFPDVSFGLGNYMVVWGDRRNGLDRVITAARVTPQWTVLDTGQVVCLNSTYQIAPAIAFGGARFLVVWQNLANPYGIYCRFLGGDGLPQDSVITISSSVTAANPRIVYGGSQFFVVWQEYEATNNIVGRFVSPVGNLVGDTIMITSGTANHVSPGVCYDGNYFLVVWSQNTICGQFISNAGNLIGAVLPISTSTNEQVDPDVFLGNDKYLAIWSEFRTDYDIYGNLDTQVGILTHRDDIPSAPDIYPDRAIFVDRVRLIGGDGKKIVVLDVLGNKVAETQNGVWCARSAAAGVYFLFLDGEQIFRVIKVK